MALAYTILNGIAVILVLIVGWQVYRASHRTRRRVTFRERLVSIAGWLVLGFAAVGFLQVFFQATFNSIGPFAQLCMLVSLTAMTVILMIPKQVRQVVVGNLLYDIIKSLWKLLIDGYYKTVSALLKR